MEKGSGFLNKSVAGFELGMLVLSLFAFSYMIYCVDVVGANPVAGTTKIGPAGETWIADDGYAWKIDGAKKEFSPNAVNIISGGFTGRVIELVERVLG